MLSFVLKRWALQKGFRGYWRNRGLLAPPSSSMDFGDAPPIIVIIVSIVVIVIAATIVITVIVVIIVIIVIILVKRNANVFFPWVLGCSCGTLPILHTTPDY